MAKLSSAPNSSRIRFGSPKARWPLFLGRDEAEIARHIANVYEEGEVDREATRAKIARVQAGVGTGVPREEEAFNLDVVISVAYRVKSKRAVEFRRWATGVLRQYVVDGYAANERRLAQLGRIARVVDCIPNSSEAKDILSVIRAYSGALDLLDDYDHQLIASMRFSRDSDLFGVEKDDSFRSSISAIYQGFGGQDMYPTIGEKAANLLYFVVKNHSFHDGNKRIAAALFLYFLNMNDSLWADGVKCISDSALVALTIMIAESKPDEKEAMVALAMSFLSMG